MTTPAGPAPGTDVPVPVFSVVEDWVAEYFLLMFRRPLGGMYRWCPQWWAHPEAVSRLTALWRSWEAMRLEPATGISDWYGSHLDHHLPILLGPDGPFCQCSKDGHLELPPFPADPVDYDLLDQDDDSAAPPIGPPPGAGDGG
jgi:hypothetical protein